MDKSHVIAIMAAIIYQSSKSLDNTEASVATAYGLYDRVIEQSPEVAATRKTVREIELP